MKTHLEPNVVLRDANITDVPEIWRMSRDLAQHVGQLADFSATEASMAEGFGFIDPYRKQASVIVADQDGVVVGFVSFYDHFNTMKAQWGIFMDNLYIKPKWRKQGIGKLLVAKVAQIARDNNRGYVEWLTHRCNANAQQAYHALGAAAPLVADQWLLPKEGIDKLLHERYSATDGKHDMSTAV
eukprot:Gregarina_sp_Poly_1__9953@NODE_658_length_6911_cov_118_518703_g500_i0_p2_GENE_NODE_658_length_6911_cov_118_518703_g500_i0NODE_658_length_6911_cov_118_518703_g500_i0_p2_ORF_typecomplete_len184_score33_66Acetyltransf_1/PF00583_25/3_4e16Acetyltransf_10/PF13673_7/9_5e13Acetyltransf_7/PF13508_7/4_9e10Acetyltransf_4/PF13420_7/6_9e09Acetyltransf_3/PF13302_7/2_4e06FR47/PF08445_10/1_1e05Acetyltransf_9/PF13527_7/4e05Acetyltransf_6/PF13480_7/0_00028Acetyltransf_CG/PF14542_6/0_00087DUF1248/PF06852_12/0_0006